MKIYFAGEPYSHLELNLYKKGVRNRLFSYYEKQYFKLALKKIKDKGFTYEENKCK